MITGDLETAHNEQSADGPKALRAVLHMYTGIAFRTVTALNKCVC